LLGWDPGFAYGFFKVFLREHFVHAIKRNLRNVPAGTLWKTQQDGVAICNRLDILSHFLARIIGFVM
jgi:hypothetical protein